MTLFGGSDARASARNSRLFQEARRRLGLEIRAITYRNAAAGSLKSGGTLTQIVRALDETTVVAITEALDGIATVTARSGRKREQLLDQLQTGLEEHHTAARAMFEEVKTRIGLGEGLGAAEPSIVEAESRHRDKITDFGEGWTAPEGKIFKERHPYAYDSLLLLIGAGIGFTLQPLANRLFGPEDSAPAKKITRVAPGVAPVRNPVPRSVKRN